MSVSDLLRTAAQDRAAALEAEFVGTEHLFLAWLQHADGAIHEAVVSAGLTPEAFTLIMQQSRSPRRAPVTDAAPGALSPQAEKILTRADERAASIGRSEIIWDDLILALVHEPRGAIARALTTHTLKPSRFKSLASDRPPRRAATPRTTAAPEAGAAQAAPEETPPKRSERSREPREKERGKGSDAVKEAAGRERGRGKGRGDPEIDDIPEGRVPERPALTPAPRPVIDVADGGGSQAGIPRLWWGSAIGVGCVLLLGREISTSVTMTIWIGVVLLLVGTTAASDAMERASRGLGAGLQQQVLGLVGNLGLLVIAVAALRAGYPILARDLLVGGLLAHLLLVPGMGLLLSGRRVGWPRFARAGTGLAIPILGLAVATLLVPTLAGNQISPVGQATLSWVTAAALGVTWVAILIQTLRVDREHRDQDQSGLGLSSAIAAVLFWGGGTVGAAWIFSEHFAVLAETQGEMHRLWGMVIIPAAAVLGGHLVALREGWRHNPEVVHRLTSTAAAQLVTLVVPILVLVGSLQEKVVPLQLLPWQAGVVAGGVLVSAITAMEGESHWLAGLQLLALQVLIGLLVWVA